MERAARHGAPGLTGVDAVEEIRTGTVTLLRWTRLDPAEAWAAIAASLDHVGPWMEWARPDYSEADAAAFRAGCDERWGRDFHYAVMTPDEQIAGACSLMSRAGGVYEIGYWLHPDHLGRGYATAAAGALVAEAFRSGARAVEIVHDEANERSAGVPLRLGFMAVERRTANARNAPAESGVDVVWRLRPP